VSIVPENGSVEIGHIHFSPVLQKTREATEAIYLLMQYIFDELGYRRLEWKCDNLNSRSKRSALRFSFTFEGIFRQHRIYKNRNRDTAWFSILDHEWHNQLRENYEKWLSPSNFDETGKQLNPLSLPILC
jgi:RimJ/RimL family protein N-acetyltransferase